MSPKKRGTTLDKFRSEYIVYGDFECKAPYTLATSAYWVPLSKLIKNLTRATAEKEIEVFEGNVEELRANEFEGRSRRRRRTRTTSRQGCHYYAIT
jgi:hypothetical protein